MNINRIRSLFVATALTCSMISVPVLGAPNTSNLEEQKRTAQNEVGSLQSQLNSLMSAMNELEGQLVTKGQEISQAKEDLVVAEEKEVQQYEDMKLRIKYMYEEGDGSALERILVSGSISDLLTEAEYVEKVHSYDREMLRDYAETVKEIDTLKSTLETDMAKLEGIEQDYKTQSEELSTVLDGKRAEVSNLDSMIQEAARAALAEQKRQEEAAKKAAEEKKPSQDGTNGAQGGNQSGENANSPTQTPPTQTPPQNQPTVPDINEPSGGNTNTAPPEPDYSASTGNAVVDRAYSWVGRAEYVYGACSPGAFDCSGFVSYCLTGSYSRLGNTFTFLGWSQVSNPQPGDVAVNAGHCGIYIGGGQMIHAATEGVGVITGPVQGGMIFVRR